MSDDSWSRSYYGHPLLPCGFNADDNNGDEVDGAGTNWPIWPVYTDLFVGLDVVIVTEAMLESFVTECPDYVVPCEADTVVFPREIEAVQVAGIIGDYVVPCVGDTLTLPQEVEELVLKKKAA